MKIATVRDFRDNATGFFRSRDPILVTRRGRPAGVFFPWTEDEFPLELKKAAFNVFATRLNAEVKAAGTTEEEVLKDFKSWRKSRRETRRGR